MTGNVIKLMEKSGKQTEVKALNADKVEVNACFKSAIVFYTLIIRQNTSYGDKSTQIFAVRRTIF